MHPFLWNQLLYFFDSFGFLQVKKIPPWRFEISESAVRDLSRDIVVAWNHGVHSLNSLSRGGDWIKFFKVQFYILRTSLMLIKHDKNWLLSLNRFKKTDCGLTISHQTARIPFLGNISLHRYTKLLVSLHIFLIHYCLPDHKIEQFTAMSFSFTAFFIYEQYEVELYHIARIFIECLTVVKEMALKNLPLPDASSKPMFMWKLPSQGDNLRD